jgi:hypothetical protein
MVAGCNINRPTDEMLLAAGEWETKDLFMMKEEKPWEIIPHVWGRLTKPTEIAG